MGAHSQGLTSPVGSGLSVGPLKWSSAARVSALIIWSLLKSVARLASAQIRGLQPRLPVDLDRTGVDAPGAGVAEGVGVPLYDHGADPVRGEEDGGRQAGDRASDHQHLHL